MKMYKKPITEIAAVDTERMMDDLIVSFGGQTGGGDVPQPHAPRRGTPIPD